MTDEEIRIAVAEACGSYWWKPNAGWGLIQLLPKNESFSGGVVVDRPIPPVIFGIDRTPNYTNDLNASQEMEEAIPEARRGSYNAELSKLATDRNLSSAVKEPEFIFQLIHATARQRAEAFLRAMGKWQHESAPKP